MTGSIGFTMGRAWMRTWNWVKGPPIPKEKRWSPHTWLNIACVCGIVFILLGRHIEDNYRIGMVTANTQCIPGRYFWMWLDDDAVIERGETYVYRARGMEPILADGLMIVKLAAGLPGDRVRVNAEGIFINDKLWGPLNPEVMKKAGLTVEDVTTEYVVAEDELVMLGNLSRTYDARYTGPIKYKQLLGGAQRLW